MVGWLRRFTGPVVPFSEQGRSVTCRSRWSPKGVFLKRKRITRKKEKAAPHTYLRLSTPTASLLIQDYCESPKSHTFAVLGITCIRDKEVVCPGKAGGAPCCPTFDVDLVWISTFEKWWGKKDHTFAVLGITCIRDKEVVCPGKAGILCIRDNLY